MAHTCICNTETINCFCPMHGAIKPTKTTPYVSQGTLPISPSNTGTDSIEEREYTRDEWREKAIALWTLLDDIDTASDIFKPQPTGFYRYTMAKAAERFTQLTSDGHRLF